MIATTVGVIWGALMPVWTNVLSKRRLLAKPWRHVAFGIAGGYLGYNWTKWENDLNAKINARKVAMGLPEEVRVGEQKILGTAPTESDWGN